MAGFQPQASETLAFRLSSATATQKEALVVQSVSLRAPRFGRAPRILGHNPGVTHGAERTCRSPRQVQLSLWTRGRRDDTAAGLLPTLPTRNYQGTALLLGKSFYAGDVVFGYLRSYETGPPTVGSASQGGNEVRAVEYGTGESGSTDGCCREVRPLDVGACEVGRLETYAVEPRLPEIEASKIGAPEIRV